MKIYNKLVRDEIPNIILKNNKIPNIKILSDTEYIKELNKKLLEEVNEYLQDDSIEEIADIQEVILAILKYKKISSDKVEAIRIKKAKERGSFDKRIFLEKVRNINN